MLIGHIGLLPMAGVRAHEFGHMLGQVDEYYENPTCHNGNPVNTSTVTDNNSNIVSAIIMTVPTI